MYEIDSRMYDLNIYSDLNAEKQNIIRQLVDMFYGTPLSKIRDICDHCMWNVDICIDSLIKVDSDPKQAQSKALNPNAPCFTRILPIASGAVPKVNTYGTAAQHSKINIQGLPAAYAGVYDNISNGYKVLILLRGAPGSGKSHLAKSIVQKLMPGMDLRDFVISADDYFFDSTGRYRFNVDRLDDAHNYCHSRAREKTSLGWSPIIVDNTHMQLWEMIPYAQAAVKNGYIIEIMEPVTPWRNSVGKLASKNIHNVPKMKIQRMLEKYEFGTTKDVMMLLKQTKYTVPLPQYRTYPPHPTSKSFQSVPVQRQQTRTNIAIPTPKDISNKTVEVKTNPTQTNEEHAVIESSISCIESANDAKPTIAPKSPRKNQKQHQKEQQQQLEPQVKEPAAFAKEATNFWSLPLTPSRSETHIDDDEIQLLSTAPVVWQAYEQEATKFWGIPVSSTPSKTVEPMKVEQNEGCGLLQLLKEGVKSINVPNKEKSTTNELKSATNDLKRHRVGCLNENCSFVGLRQIYPNKPTAELWDLFVKCNGSIDWAVDILLKDDDLVSRETSSDLIENCDNYDCGCDSPMKEPPTIIGIPIVEVNVKPQRPKAARNRACTAEFLEVKEAVENSFVLGDEHYSSHVKKIRNKRHTTVDPSSTQKTFIDIQVQTDADENDTISEDCPEVSEMLEIDLGEDLIGQLSMIFKSEIPALAMPEKFKSNVFMPKTLARELYLLWMESLYNQMEEQRQNILKEDEDFARLLKNPKYENCKQPPDNIKELLDMEYAWMIYKTEQEECCASANQHECPNDLASHLTRMKLCELFPNIPKDTLCDILAAHNNKFSDTVEVLKSSIPSATIDHQVSTKVLIEKAIDENDKLNKEVDQGPKLTKTDNNISHSSSFTQIHSMSNQDQSEGIVRRRSMSPDEAKRLALKEFEDSRNYAAHHCQLRAECYQKAKEAIQRGNSGVAVYYSQIANLHKRKIDIYNHRAANCIMEVHDLTQNNPDFIDLHYLHVIEAIACLDIFVDKHIAKLRSIFRSFKYVFIITGRGLHSTGGVSTIKTRVKSRLKERNLKWSEVNPGLLKVKIFSASKYSKNL